VPDVSAFPRAAWLRSLRSALSEASDAELTHADLGGVEALRVALADYLGRVRGVVADPERVVVTCGYTQGLDVVCHALAARGAKRIAFEDPSDYEPHWTAERSGLETVPVAVDDDGLRIDELARADPDAVVATPAHQHPTGVVLSSDRRAELVAWLRERDAIAIEDDYDAEYRYERAAIGALQGLEPERVVYAGSASKTLAPGLRLGWLVVPPWLLDAVRHQKLLTDRGTARLEQHAFADFLARGELDRHLRRMRGRYRARRDALVAALAEELPQAIVRGISAGLHATVELPEGHDERAILAEARRRRIELVGMGELRINVPRPPTLLLGYAQLPEPTIPVAVRELAAAIAAASSP
jgi:GntR family transcriptional regulator/MocR family aminotransferase